MRITKFLFSILVMILVITGCSKTDSTVLTDTGSSGSDELPLAEMDSGSQGTSQVGILGAYELHIDPASMTAEMISKRSSAIGESYIVSGLPFFTIFPCTDCFRLDSIHIDDGNLVLNFFIKHPFEPGDPSEPPSGINRLDLDVFDTALVIYPQGVVSTNYPLTSVSIYDGVIANADGYTREIEEVIVDPAALPYVLVVDDNEDETNTFNEFAMGDETYFDVEFDLQPGGSLVFDMYITMGYGFSAVKADRLHPKYYNPEFNRKAAWKVEAKSLDTGESPLDVLDMWDDGESAINYMVVVLAYDWQIGADVWDGVGDFGDAEITEIASVSDVELVSVEIPGMTSALPEIDGEFAGGSGMPDDPLIYIVSINNEYLLPHGDYVALARVMDEREPAIGPGAEATGDTLIDTPDGTTLTTFYMPEYATYIEFEVTINPPPDPLCGRISGTIIDPPDRIIQVGNGGIVDFEVMAISQDGSGSIGRYYADFNFNFLQFVFTSDQNVGVEPGGEGLFNGVPFVHSDPTTGKSEQVTVVFAAADNCTPINYTAFAWCIVEISPF